MTFQSLPHELLVMIGGCLDTQTDISALMRVNRRLYILLNPLLYQYNVKHHRGRGIFHATETGMLSVVQQFIAAGYDVRYKSSYPKARELHGAAPLAPGGGYALEHPILNACRYGHVEVVRYFLQQGSDPNFMDYQRNTPLQLAAENGSLPIIELLVKEIGYELNEHTMNTELSLKLAARHGHMSVVEYFLGIMEQQPAHENLYHSIIKKCLPSAAASGQVGMVSLLLQHGAEVNFRYGGDTPLISAARYGHQDMVKFLLANRAAVPPIVLALRSDDHDYALTLAIGRGHAEIIHMLLDGYRDQSEEVPWDAAFKRAIGRGRADVIQLLLTRHEDVEWGRYNLLAFAAECGNVEIMKMLLDEGFDEQRALAAGVRSEHEEVVRLLLDRGVSPDTPMNMVKIALHRRHVAILRILLEAGAHIYSRCWKQAQNAPKEIRKLADQFPCSGNKNRFNSQPRGIEGDEEK